MGLNAPTRAGFHRRAVRRTFAVVRPRCVRVVALALWSLALACAKASPPVDPRETVLAHVDTMPRMAITVPSFMRSSTLDGGVYMFDGGSLREGLLAYVMVGPDPRSGAAPTRHELPRCLGEEIVETRDGLEIATCNETNRRSIHVTHPSDRGPIVCTATWTASEPLADARKQDASDVERACFTLRVL